MISGQSVYVLGPLHPGSGLRLFGNLHRECPWRYHSRTDGSASLFIPGDLSHLSRLNGLTLCWRRQGDGNPRAPQLEELLDQYLETSGLRNQPNAPLFPIALGKTRKLGNRPATRIDAARMLKRRLKDAGLSDAFSPHSFRATGITNFLENGGTLEVAQRIAGHADSRTTKLYVRRGQKVLVEDMERIRY